MRLPLLISALLVTVVATFLFAAHREVEAALLQAGRERAKAAADQVAGLMERPSQTGMQTLRRIATDAVLRRSLQSPSDATRDAARAHLTSLTALGTTGPRRIELWNVAGSRLVDIFIPAKPVPGEAPVVLPAATSPPAVGFNPLQSVGNLVFTDSVAEIVGEPASTGEAATPPRLGYLVVRSTLAVNPSGTLGRLVGSDAVVEIGNTAGGTWTDLSRVVPAPPVDTTRSGVSEYRAENGERRLGALSPIRATPWAVWIEFPRSVIVAPARAFLRRMIRARPDCRGDWRAARRRVERPNHQAASRARASHRRDCRRRLLAAGQRVAHR